MRLWWKQVDTLVSGTSAGQPAWEFDSLQAHQPGGRGPVA